MWNLFILLAGLLVAAIAYEGTKEFRLHTIRKFGYDFFSEPNLYAFVGSVVFAVCGYFVYTYSPAPGRAAIEPMNWVVLFGLAALIQIVVVVINFKKTDVRYGLIGSTAQIFVLAAMAVIGIVTWCCFLLSCMLGNASTRHDDNDAASDQQKAYDEWMALDINKDSSNYRFKDDKSSGY